MYREFKNESWTLANERDSYLRTLKMIRFYKSSFRTNKEHTTTLIFFSRLTDVPVRHHFEESSRFFKTYNLFADLTYILRSQTSASDKRLKRIPVWFLDVLEKFFGIKIISYLLGWMLPNSICDHLDYRSRLRALSEEEFVEEIALVFKSMGLLSLPHLSVLVGDDEDMNLQFGIKLLAKALNSSVVKCLLREKGILVPDAGLTLWGVFQKNKNLFGFKASIGALDNREVFRDHLGKHKKAINYLERKAKWIINVKKIKPVQAGTSKNDSTIILIGRRHLTKGHIPLNESTFVQSYDFSCDDDFSSIKLMLKTFLTSLGQSNALLVIENYPNHISCLISKDAELQSMLHGKSVALACVDPESRDIYTFEGDQFVQRNLKQVY